MKYDKHEVREDYLRKKDWKREYEISKKPGRYRDDIGSGSFVINNKEPHIIRRVKLYYPYNQTHCISDGDNSHTLLTYVRNKHTIHM